MPFRDVANPNELSLLRAALAEICAELGIQENDEDLRTELAAGVLTVFNGGASTVEEIKQGVNESMHCRFSTERAPRSRKGRCMEPSEHYGSK